MEITHLGHASFKIRGKALSDWVTIITDPFEEKMLGVKFPKLTTVDIVTISHDHPDHNDESVLKGLETKPKIFHGPGEYEVKGVIMRGVATHHDTENGSERGENTVFVFDLEGVKIAHLGDLGHKLTEAQLSAIGTVNVLLVPVGGFYTIDPQTAVEVIGQLEPILVIPMHYKVPGMGSTFDNLSDLSEFEKAIGVEIKRQDKLDLKGLPEGEEMQVIALETKK